MDEETLIGYSRNNCPCFRSKAHPLLATGRTCINGLTGVPNLDTGQVQFPQQEHLLLYRITVRIPWRPGLLGASRVLSPSSRELQSSH